MAQSWCVSVYESFKRAGECEHGRVRDLGDDTIFTKKPRMMQPALDLDHGETMATAARLWCMWRKDGSRLTTSEEVMAKGIYADGVWQEQQSR